MATGVPAPQIKWYRNAADITTMGNSRFRVSLFMQIIYIIVLLLEQDMETLWYIGSLNI